MTTEDKYIKNTTLTLFKFSFLLILATSVARLSSSIYLPALLQIGDDLQLSENILGQTLTIFFIAFSISTLFVGPLVDSYGRKNTILLGSIIFLIGSSMCASSFSGTTLILGRVFQAIGASFLPVASRAMIRDMCTDRQVVSVLGWIALLGGVLPIIAPVLGGFITKILDWRYTFWFLVALSIFSIFLLSLKLPRSISKKELQPFKIKSILKNYIFIVTSTKFFMVIIPLSLAFALQGAYLVTSPFIFMKHFNLSPIEYGFINVIVVSAMFLGRYLASYIIEKKNIYIAYLTGAALTFIGGIIFEITIYIHLDTIYATITSLFIIILGFGTMLIIGVKSIMTAFKNNAGIASALHGCFTLGLTAIGSLVVTKIKDIYHISSIESLGLFILFTTTFLLFFTFFTKKYLI